MEVLAKCEKCGNIIEARDTCACCDKVINHYVYDGKQLENDLWQNNIYLRITSMMPGHPIFDFHFCSANCLVKWMRTATVETFPLLP